MNESIIDNIKSKIDNTFKEPWISNWHLIRIDQVRRGGFKLEDICTPQPNPIWILDHVRSWTKKKKKFKDKIKEHLWREKKITFCLAKLCYVYGRSNFSQLINSRISKLRIWDPWRGRSDWVISSNWLIHQGFIY